MDEQGEILELILLLLDDMGKNPGFEPLDCRKGHCGCDI